MELAESMKHSRLFAVSEVAAIFGPNFLDDEVCRQWILKRLHPAGAFCPSCGSGMQGRASDRFWQGRPVTCAGCDKDFTARTGTILAGKNLSYREIILVAYLMARGDSNTDIAETVGCNRETVRLWRQQFAQL